MAFYLHVFTVLCMTLPSAMGYNLVFGKGKIMHFGQIGFSLVGTYLLFGLSIRAGVAFPLALLASVAGVFCLAAVFTWLSLRLEPDGLGVMSIAVHLALLAVALNWQSATRGALGIPGISRPFFAQSAESFALFTAALCVVWLTFLYVVFRGSFGRALRALSQHHWHAASLGIDRRFVHFSVFLIAGFGALLTNYLFHSYLHLLSPNDLNFPTMIFYIMVVLAGGPGSFWGVLSSTVILILLREGLRFVDISPDLVGPVQLMLFGVILFVAVWLRRDSVFPKQRSV